MKKQGLLLARHTGRRRPREHDSKVVTLRSNIRWCSDGLEFTCWNGEVVRVAFALDCHDREVIGWVATTAGISGEMIRDLMVECVETRFHAPRAPHRVQWLADNGSVYAAGKTLDIAVALNLEPCFTPVKSPESNGVVEAFAKTFKRDYVRVNPLRDAASAIAAIASWMDDYNEVHPHSRLAYRSPREYIRDQIATRRVSGLIGSTPLVCILLVQDKSLIREFGYLCACELRDHPRSDEMMGTAWQHERGSTIDGLRERNRSFRSAPTDRLLA